MVGVVLARAVMWFGQLMIFALLGRAILSWFSGAGNTQVSNFYKFLIMITEPIVSPCRSILSRFNTGMLDFSVLLAMLLIEAVCNIIARLLLAFL